ncbi:SMP-30/gluconolactonase/LRE family protein [Nannocystaceae bacterium ST9]
MRARVGLLVGGLMISIGCRGEAREQVAAAEPSVFADEQAEPFTRLRAFAEGPTWHPDGYLLFTDIGNNRMLIYRRGVSTLEVFAEPSGRAAGTALDAQGRLVACEGNEYGIGGRALVRWDLATRTREVIVDRYEGKRFNSPNDLAIDREGRIYFSDPHYYEDPFAEIVQLDAEAVYRVDPDGSDLIRVLGPEQVLRPNGVELSLDERTLYVTDTTIDGIQRLYAFALDEQGLATGERELIYDFGTGRGGDGMCMDAAGNLFVGAGTHRPPGALHDQPAGLHVFGPSGEPIQTLAIDDYTITNCTHGGGDGKTIFITGAGFLWKIRGLHPGARHATEPG